MPRGSARAGPPESYSRGKPRAISLLKRAASYDGTESDTWRTWRTGEEAGAHETPDARSPAGDGEAPGLSRKAGESPAAPSSTEAQEVTSRRV